MLGTEPSGASAASTRWCTRSAAAEDLKGAASPLNLAREELRTIHHNLRDLHARSAPMAKLVLLRLNDHIAGAPQNLDSRP